jgi:hypothetical protein
MVLVVILEKEKIKSNERSKSWQKPTWSFGSIIVELDHVK